MDTGHKVRKAWLVHTELREKMALVARVFHIVPTWSRFDITDLEVLCKMICDTIPSALPHTETKTE